MTDATTDKSGEDLKKEVEGTNPVTVETSADVVDDVPDPDEDDLDDLDGMLALCYVPRTTVSLLTTSQTCSRTSPP